MAASLFRLVLLVALVLPLASALSANYYSKSCPKLFQVVNPIVANAIKREARLGASILRLFFHDCFVNGCDGSLLLDDTSTFTGEKTATPNLNSVRGFDVIDDIKDALEKECPGVVSCADILAIAAQISVTNLKGPKWRSLLGRLDARTASKDLANTNLPPPFENLDGLIKAFQNLGLSTKDMVVLSGAHTIGLAACVTFKTRIYNETNIDPTFAAKRQDTCPFTGGNGNLAPLDIITPTTFDNSYYKNLVLKKGLLHSDQAIFDGGSTDDLVLKYSRNQRAFFNDFKTSMTNMGNLKPDSGTPLEVRKNCRVVN